MNSQNQYDVIIIGGSYAGLSAALALGRSLRRVLVIDSGMPCNQPVREAHNFLTHDGSAPADIAFTARAQVMLYPTIDLVNATAVDAELDNRGFKITTDEEQTFSCRKLLFATGIKDMLPNIEGLKECWGISILHCPYCHGYEYNQEPTGIIATGNIAFEMARLLSNRTADLTIFSNGPSGLSTEELARLQQHDIEIIEKKISHLIHENGHLKQVVCDDGTQHGLSAMYIRPEFKQHCPLPASLGCRLTESGHIEISEMKLTSVPGVFAAGDCTSPFRSIASAVAAGSMAGAAINHELIQQDSN